MNVVALTGTTFVTRGLRYIPQSVNLLKYLSTPAMIGPSPTPSLNAHQPATQRQAEILRPVEGIERQLSFGAAGVAIGVGQFQPGRDGKEKTGIKGVRDPDQVAQVHRLGNAFDTDSEISPHPA